MITPSRRALPGTVDVVAAPSPPVLVFDGDCSFCTSSVNVLQRLVKRLPPIVPWQHIDLDALGLTRQQCEEAVQWVGPDGQVRSGEAAVAQVLVDAGKGWRLLGRLMLLPGVRWLAGVVYRWTARHRHRLPGGTPACSLPSPPADDGRGAEAP